MDELSTKLTRCFTTVFPGLDPSRAAAASVETVPEWDSVAQITLLTVIGEEFGFEPDFERFEGATSFASILDRLRAPN